MDLRADGPGGVPMNGTAAPRNAVVRWLACIVLLLAAASAHAQCASTGVSVIPLGSKTSFEAQVADDNAGSGSGGLSCPGLIGLLSSQYIFLTLSAKDPALINAAGDAIGFDVTVAPAGQALEVGEISPNLAAAGSLTLTGASSEVAIFARLAAAPNVSAGTYLGTLSLLWHYATCPSLDAVGICVGPWAVSPGITQNCLPVLMLCTLNVTSLPGSGVPVDIEFTLEIAPDCRFVETDIDFGSAPFVDAFAPVAGSIQITCTRGETYTVGLSKGDFFSGGRRRMANGAELLEYDVFRPGSVPWNDTDHRAAQPIPAPGDAPQTFPYEARIYTDQPTPAVGNYSDTLILDVEF